MSLQTEIIMEHHAYLRSAAIEEGFGVDYGSADKVKSLESRLPAGFNYNR